MEGDCLYHENRSGATYGFACRTAVHHRLYGPAAPVRGEVCDQKTVAHTFAFPAEEGKTYTLEKTVYIITSRDTQENLEQATRQAMERLSGSRYAALLEDSQRVYGELFRRIDVTVDGDDEADGSIPPEQLPHPYLHRPQRRGAQPVRQSPDRRDL